MARRRPFISGAGAPWMARGHGRASGASALARLVQRWRLRLGALRGRAGCGFCFVAPTRARVSGNATICELFIRSSRFVYHFFSRPFRLSPSPCAPGAVDLRRSQRTHAALVMPQPQATILCSVCLSPCFPSVSLVHVPLARFLISSCVAAVRARALLVMPQTTNCYVHGLITLSPVPRHCCLPLLLRALRDGHAS